MAQTLPLAMSQSVARDLYSRALANAYNYWQQIYDPSYSLSRDPDMFEKVMRDPVIAKAWNKRSHDIAGRSWRIAASSESKNDKTVAKIVESAFKKIRHFAEARHELAQAIMRGQAFCEIRGRRTFTNLAGYQGDWWYPTYLKDIDHRRFKWVPIRSENEISTELHMSSNLELGQFVRLERPELYIKVTYSDEEARLGYGRALMDTIFFYWWMVQNALRDCANWVERWSQGVITAKIDSLREASTDNDNSTIRQEWLDELEKMRSRHVLVYGKEDEFSLIESQGTGYQGTMDFIQFLYSKIEAVVAGSFFSVGEQVGSFAKDKVQENQGESLVQFDREKIAEDITHDLTGLFVKLNQPVFQGLGLDPSNVPAFEIIQEKKEDPLVAAQVAQTLLSVGEGMELRLDEVLSKTGFSPVSDEDRATGNVIAGRSAPTLNSFGEPSSDPFGGSGDNGQREQEPGAKPDRPPFPNEGERAA